MNDTIVVNQPRLTTEEDIMAENDGEMEMTIVGEEELAGGHPVCIFPLYYSQTKLLYIHILLMVVCCVFHHLAGVHCGTEGTCHHSGR